MTFCELHTPYSPPPSDDNQMTGSEICRHMYKQRLRNPPIEISSLTRRLQLNSVSNAKATRAPIQPNAEKQHSYCGNASLSFVLYPARKQRGSEERDLQKSKEGSRQSEDKARRGWRVPSWWMTHRCDRKVCQTTDTCCSFRPVPIHGRSFRGICGLAAVQRKTNSGNRLELESGI